MRQEVVIDFLNNFENKKEINTNEIRDFLLLHYPKMKESSFRWNLYKLKSLGHITKLTNNRYKLNIDNTKLKFKVNSKEIEVISAIKNFNKGHLGKEKFILREARNFTSISVWDIEILNQFTKHQISSNYLFVELDRYRIEDLFFYLKDNITNWYVTRDYKNETYQLEYENNVIFILPLVSRAPIEKEDLENNNYVTVPKIEKILVDIFHERKLFSMYDTNTMKEIFLNIHNEYNIDYTTLLYYASYRGKREEMASFLNSILGGKFK